MRLTAEEIVKIDTEKLIQDQLTTDDFVNMLEENDFVTDIVVRIQIINDFNKKEFVVETYHFTVELTTEYVLEKVNSEYKHTKNKYEDIRDRYYQLNQEVDDMKQELNMLRAFKDTYK
jgi:hypothetical protein